jgi:hypothetical protein
MNGLLTTPCRLQLKVEQRSQWLLRCLTAALRKRLGEVATAHISGDSAQLSCLHSYTLNTTSSVRFEAIPDHFTNHVGCN